MKPIKTLRVRFALWTTALILLILAAFGIFVYFNLSHNLIVSVDNSLSVSATVAMDEVRFQNGQLRAFPADDDEILPLTGRGLTIILSEKDGHILRAVGPHRDVVLPANTTISNNSHGSFLTFDSGVGKNDLLRALVLPVLDHGQVVGWVQVIQSLQPVQDALRLLLINLIIGAIVLVLFAAIGGYFLAARALSPINRITRTAQKIAGGEDLSARLNLPESGDEVSRLAATFDAMLVRLDGSFRRERQFIADASHELRTPLAAMQAILGVVREGQRPSSQYRLAMDDLAVETDRLRALVEDLLRLARGEDRTTLSLEPVNLSNLLTDVIDSLHPLAETKDLALHSQIVEGLALNGDMDALIRLFVNLIDNAIKYTERGEITVCARAEGNEIIVNVIDTGIGIPTQHLPHVFDRFYRVNPARPSGGVGLGLAIARQVAHMHRGRLEVVSQQGAGSTFTVALPR
jgi:signal transduction histidine kinase